MPTDDLIRLWSLNRSSPARRRRLSSSALQILDQHGHALSAAEAHRDRAVAPAGILEVVHSGDRHAHTRRPGWMADGYPATVKVGAVSGDAKLPFGMQVDDRECLVDLEVVDI